MICDTCEEYYCSGREPIYVRRAFPIPLYIERVDIEKYIRILQKKAEDTGKCKQYCDIPMSNPNFHKHRRSINASSI